MTEFVIDTCKAQKGRETLIYVLSDIHGNTRRFRSVLNQITWGENDWLYVLGDMADRGADGIAIMEELMHRPNTVVLQGNHERMLLDVFHEPDNEKFTNRWHRNGGDVTKQAFEALPQGRKDALISWLENLPLEVNLEINGQKYCLVHAAPRELYDQFETDNDLDMYTVWYRVQPEEKLFSDRITVFGHTPTEHFQSTMPMSVWYGDHRIAIDCGAAYEEPGCRLACVRLDDGKIFYSEENAQLV